MTRIYNPLFGGMGTGFRPMTSGTLMQGGQVVPSTTCFASNGNDEFVGGNAPKAPTAPAAGTSIVARQMEVSQDAPVSDTKIRELLDAEDFDAIVAFGPPAVDILAEGVKTWRGPVRMNAIWALGTFRTESATTALIRTFLEDRNYGVRGAAARALGNSGDPRAIDVIIKTTRNGLGAEEEDVEAALVAFGASAVKPLIKALRDKNEYVRRRAATVLGKIGDPRAMKPLIKLLHDEGLVSLIAARALGHIGGKDAFMP